MARKADARKLLLARIRSSPPKLVRVVGVPYFAEREVALDPDKVDHVWITIEVPPFGRIRVSINTMSRLNRDAGFDGRVRVGIVRSTWIEKPAPCLEEIDRFDYADVEASANVFYEHQEHDPLVDLLIGKADAALRLEVWGELYGRQQIGIHQLHSRRGSRAVPADLQGRDGAVKFYFASENIAELMLFKFDGQP